MSGAGSRQRRVDAVRAARASVYRRNGAAYASDANPFGNERQRAIFEKAYRQWREIYDRGEATLREMATVYGDARA